MNKYDKSKMKHFEKIMIRKECMPEKKGAYFTISFKIWVTNRLNYVNDYNHH